MLQTHWKMLYYISLIIYSLPFFISLNSQIADIFDLHWMGVNCHSGILLAEVLVPLPSSSSRPREKHQTFCFTVSALSFRANWRPPKTCSCVVLFICICTCFYLKRQERAVIFPWHSLEAHLLHITKLAHTGPVYPKRDQGIHFLPYLFTQIFTYLPVFFHSSIF